ncbi:hypothetical protein [Symmachiella dynata]|uniref:hypothetical protein n=1 Tax=Symmachiella dynata TaxID=2527995 RepID=UPI0030EB2799
MQSSVSSQLRAAYHRLKTGTTGAMMLLVPGGDRTTIGWMWFSAKIAMSLVLAFTVFALLPWTGTGSHVSLAGLCYVTLILGGFSLVVGWGLGILRNRDCPACRQAMGNAIVSEYRLPYYHCAECDTEFPVTALIAPEREERRREARQLIDQCRHPTPAPVRVQR